MSSLTLVLGLGITGKAVVESLIAHEDEVIALDDTPNHLVSTWATNAEVNLMTPPDKHEWPNLLRSFTEIVVSPGIPNCHPVFDAAAQVGIELLDESDVAARWDQRPRCAITGTNGKTSVVSLTVEMLKNSGRNAVSAGNTEIPLVKAINDQKAEVFVVEASSFRLGHARFFDAKPAAWLNFSPDHLDHHGSLEAYRLAKARIWDSIVEPDDAIANFADPVVSACAPRGSTSFGTSSSDFRVESGCLVWKEQEVLEVSRLKRSLPHDLLNAQAALAVALSFGATIEGCVKALSDFVGLEHRVSLIGEVNGVRFIDDSKATTPHATVAAMSGFPEAVLIAGGRNKNLDLSELLKAKPQAVVAIGESSKEIAEIFKNVCKATIADSMSEAVHTSAELAGTGGTVLLSPGCTSFDWYASYKERGQDFLRAVELLRSKK